MTEVKKGFHKTKDGRVVKKGLYYNMNQAKKKGTSRSKKAKALISPEAYANMKAGFPKKNS